MKRLILAAVLALGGCGHTVEACYTVEGYGEVCVLYDGKLHVRADIAADPAKLAAVKARLHDMGVEVK